VVIFCHRADFLAKNENILSESVAGSKKSTIFASHLKK
jgi:hypothetical protein